MNAHAYLRVSSPSQSAAMQRTAIERMAKARGDRIVAWHEEKRSAKTIDRPALNGVRQLAQQGHVRRLYVWKLDRLGRSGIRDVLTVIDELRAAGCDVVSVEDGFALQGHPASEMVLAALIWAGKMELQAGIERRAAAREHALANGGTWGRPRGVSEKTEARVRELRAQGRSERRIAMAVKLPKTTVHRILTGRSESKPKNGDAPTLKKARPRVDQPPPVQ